MEGVVGVLEKRTKTQRDLAQGNPQGLVACPGSRLAVLGG